MDLLQEIRRRVDADFAEPSLGYPGLTFITHSEWMADSDNDDCDDTPVCVAGGHSFPVSLRSGIEEAVVAVVSTLQDDVMDHLNRPWPELDGPAVIVLQPRIDDHGAAVWASDDGSVRCPVGELQPRFGTRGLLR